MSRRFFTHFFPFLLELFFSFRKSQRQSIDKCGVRAKIFWNILLCDINDRNVIAKYSENFICKYLMISIKCCFDFYKPGVCHYINKGKNRSKKRNV